MRIDLNKLVETHEAAKVFPRETQELLVKEDIPEVEAEIALLTPLVAALWRRGAEAALRDLLARAELLEGVRVEEFRQDVLVSIIVSIFLEFRHETLRDITALEAVRRITDAGVTRAGVEGFDPLSAELFDFQAQAADDLRFWVSRGIVERADRVRPIVLEWLGLSPEERDPSQLVGDVADVIEDPNGTTSNLIVDLWAYRTTNAAIVTTAALAGQQTLVVFNNPLGGGPDSRTTPFCRAIHGTEFSTGALRVKLRAYYDAIDRRDAEGAKRALPLLSGEEAKQESPERASNLGPPPYHNRCRTVLQVAATQRR